MESRITPYTWGDVADTIVLERSNGTVPAGAVKAEIYWDQLTLHIDDLAHVEDARAWLREAFPLRFIDDKIALDGPPFSRVLPVYFDLYDPEIAGEPPPAIAAQYVAAASNIWFRTSVAPHIDVTELPKFAFHSVKGGVGRTTSALSFAISLVNQHGRKPLLVDADFEAPGISYLFLRDGRECHFSLEDLIVLAHADEDPTGNGAIAFGAEKLLNQTHEGIAFLPCLRRADMLSSFAIRPEQLQRSHSDRPFFLLSVLERLAVESGCDCLVIDLRAGFTDLAAMILCAPGVAPVFVTTPGGQSVASTQEMMAFIGRETEKNKRWRGRPAVIVNNVIPQVRRSADFAALIEQLEAGTDSFISDGDTEVPPGSIIELAGDDVSGAPIVILDHAPSLTASAVRLRDFVDDLRTQSCFDQLAEGLLGWTREHLEVQLEKPELAPAVPKAVSNQLQEQRKALEAFAAERVFADTSREAPADFLVVRALRELGERFRTEVPNATCIGMKGAGKTFTFRLIAEIGEWERFLAKVGVSQASGSSKKEEALILPVLPARSLQTLPGLTSSRTAAATAVRGQTPIAFSRLNALIDTASKELTTESEWGRFWLDTIAWSCGLSVEQKGAGDQLVANLSSTGVRVVALFDGLEESFQSFRSAANQQAAIRGLTSSLAQILLEIPNRPLGQITFVRSDLVSSAFPNNYRQFVDRNRAFLLTWYDHDILELAAWLASQSGVADIWTADFRDLDAAAIEDKLVPLWGRKLGKADDLAKGGRTREPRSSEWVIAALSDLRGRLTARDLVGFVSNSAQRSANDENPLFSDRLLVPRAMTNAISPVGFQKIEAMGEENPALKPILQMLREAPSFAVPLTLAEFKTKVPGLGDDELEILKENGVVLVVGDSVEMPEIFRTGLGNVARSTGGRKSIIGLMNKARQLRSADLGI